MIQKMYNYLVKGPPSTMFFKRVPRIYSDIVCRLGCYPVKHTLGPPSEESYLLIRKLLLPSLVKGVRCRVTPCKRTILPGIIPKFSE